MRIRIRKTVHVLINPSGEDRYFNGRSATLCGIFVGFLTTSETEDEVTCPVCEKLLGEQVLARMQGHKIFS